jgi:hypothetical protein
MVLGVPARRRQPNCPSSIPFLQFFFLGSCGCCCDLHHGPSLVRLTTPFLHSTGAKKIRNSIEYYGLRKISDSNTAFHYPRIQRSVTFNRRNTIWLTPRNIPTLYLSKTPCAPCPIIIMSRPSETSYPICTRFIGFITRLELYQQQCMQDLPHLERAR